jgi:hypothetical protein
VTSLPAGRQVCPRGENEAKLAFCAAVISIRMAKNLPKSPFCGMIQPADAGCCNCPKTREIWFPCNINVLLRAPSFVLYVISDVGGIFYAFFTIGDQKRSNSNQPG